MTNQNSHIPYNPQGQVTSYTEDSNPPDILTVSLIVLFHIRFIFIIILQTRTIALDAIFYILVLATLCTMKLNKYCLVLVPLIFISLINSAAQNIFLLLSSSYIIAVKMPLKQVLKINAICIIAVISMVVLMVKAGIIQEHVYTTGYYLNGTLYNQRLRSDLGFGNPNRVAILVYSLSINLFLLIKKQKMNLFLIALSLTSYYVYILTDSRTFVLSIASFILAIIGLRFKNVAKIFLKSRMVLFYSPILFLIILFYITKSGYNNLSIEILTSGRLGLFKELINHCSFQDYIIGTNLINEKTIDNTYLHLLFSAGILGFVTMGYLWYKLLYSLNEKISLLYPILLSITIYGFGESLWVVILCYGNMIIWIMMIKNLILPNDFNREIERLS